MNFEVSAMNFQRLDQAKRSNVSIALLYTLCSTLLVLSSACNGGKMPEKTISLTATIKDIPESAWTKLSQKKIFFGHQSVGNNIIDGIRDLMKENHQIRLNIVETSNPSDFNYPLFAHARVGKNMDPQSKIDAFADFMEKGIGGSADIAFFKFCYVDVMAGTDVHKVFTEYMNTMSRLKKTYPKTTFIHVTVPLTSKLTGIDSLIRKAKNLIKKVMGRPVFGYHDNIERNKFNEMLRKEYDGKEPIFDLAKTESTFPKRNRSSFTKNGQTYYALVPDYTYDSGHLNEVGRKIVAEQFLIFLANLSK